MKTDTAGHAKASSCAFYAAYRRCNEKRPLGPNTFQWLLIPAVVCSAFSIELAIKALLLRAGGKATGHELVKLFARLRPEERDLVQTAVAMSPAQFQKELAAVSDAFVEWRYIYERLNDPTANIHVNLHFLDQLATALQKAL